MSTTSDTTTQPKYTCGFLFDHTGSNVVLIEKQRPDWQKGKWNGIGGKIEDGETPVECMRREFREETGVDIAGWTHYAMLCDMRGYRVAFFYAYNNNLKEVRTMTDEAVSWHTIDCLPDVIPNLRWLIPMAQAIQFDRADSFQIIEIDEADAVEVVGGGESNTEPLREQLAAYAHTAWSGWMAYLFYKCGTMNDDGSFTITAPSVGRWERQHLTDYADLPESEKESDRAEADKILAIVGQSDYHILHKQQLYGSLLRVLSTEEASQLGYGLLGSVGRARLIAEATAEYEAALATAQQERDAAQKKLERLEFDGSSHGRKFKTVECATLGTNWLDIFDIDGNLFAAEVYAKVATDFVADPRWYSHVFASIAQQRGRTLENMHCWQNGLSEEVSAWLFQRTRDAERLEYELSTTRTQLEQLLERVTALPDYFRQVARQCCQEPNRNPFTESLAVELERFAVEFSRHEQSPAAGVGEDTRLQPTTEEQAQWDATCKARGCHEPQGQADGSVSCICCGRILCETTYGFVVASGAEAI